MEEPKERNGRIVIQPGNNLWKLSRVIYGRGVHYAVIYEANRSRSAIPTSSIRARSSPSPMRRRPSRSTPSAEQSADAGRGRNGARMKRGNSPRANQRARRGDGSHWQTLRSLCPISGRTGALDLKLRVVGGDRCC